MQFADLKAVGSVSRALGLAAAMAIDCAAAMECSRASDAFRYSEPKMVRLRCSITVSAPRSTTLRRVIATCPVPREWPEQKVKLLEEHKPRGVTTQVTTLGDAGDMLVVRVPAIPAGRSMTVERLYELERSRIEFVLDPRELHAPSKPSRKTRAYLEMGLDVGSRTGPFRELADSIRRPDDGDWNTVRRYHDWLRENVRYEEGTFRGAPATLETRTGDCEDLTALFVALCRESEIPARSVWVEGHAYPEFYLEDAGGTGYWIPAQVAGPDWFGEMADYRPILQKGDRVRDPIRDRDMRYIPQSARSSGGAARLEVLRTLEGAPQ